jgi:hypothetical protein
MSWLFDLKYFHKVEINSILFSKQFQIQKMTFLIPTINKEEWSPHTVFLDMHPNKGKKPQTKENHNDWYHGLWTWQGN